MPYSEHALRLARELGEKAAANLRRAGYTVERDPVTGKYSYTRPTTSEDVPEKPGKSTKTRIWSIMKRTLVAIMGGVGLVLIALGLIVLIFGGDTVWLVSGLTFLALSTSAEAGWARSDAEKALRLAYSAQLTAENAFDVARVAANSAQAVKDSKKGWPYGG